MTRTSSALAAPDPICYTVNMILNIGKYGRKVHIDKDDYERLDLKNANCITVTSHGYVAVVEPSGEKTAAGWYRYKRTYLHRLVLSAPKNLQVDHINGDKLDNRKENLRLCKSASNSRNKRQINGEYKGVHQTKSGWAAQITKSRHMYHLGCFDNQHDAANAYNVAAKKLHGKYAYLNKITAELKGEAAVRKKRAREPKQPRGPLAKDTHGTPASYKHGKCRCEPCRSANRDYAKRFYKK